MFDDQFAQLPPNPPRRPATLPGLRFAAAVSRSALVLPLVFVCFFTLIPLSIAISDPAMRLALSPTRTVQGRVLSAASVSACRGSSAHRVTYTFSLESGRALRGVATLCEESPYYSVGEGDSIEVQYVAGNPSINSMQGGTRNDSPPVALFLLMPVFILAMFWPMFWPQVRELLRARRLYRKGQIALGTVIFVKKRVTASWPGWPGNSAAEIFIEFQPTGGVKREAVAWCPNDWIVYNLAPGAEVHLAYTDDKPNRVALLEAFLR
jgi:hypothetical protein